MLSLLLAQRSNLQIKNLVRTLLKMLSLLIQTTINYVLTPEFKAKGLSQLFEPIQIQTPVIANTITV